MYLSVNDVAARFSVHTNTIWRWMKRKNNPFPKPVKLTESTTRWKLEDVDAWAAQVAGQG